MGSTEEGVRSRVFFFFAVGFAASLSRFFRQRVWHFLMCFLKEKLRLFIYILAMMLMLVTQLEEEGGESGWKRSWR